MPINVSIINYRSSNSKNVHFALNKLGVQNKLTLDYNEIQTASHVIFPGVGSAGSAMSELKMHGLDRLIPSLKQPVLGICLGMQLLCKFTDEDDVKGLGVFNTIVKKFQSNTVKEKVPHMGWNQITELNSYLFNNIKNYDQVYFVHSYFAKPSLETIAYTNHINSFSAALQHKNFYGVQFHPEKSAKIGQQILYNFINKIS